MPYSVEPTAVLSLLPRADGSATFSQNGYIVTGAVNGPIEVQRRDELPEEAVIDVLVRPAAGVGGTRERHLESILQSTLRHIILIHNFPRTLIQLTLQITSTPEIDSTNSKLVQASSNLPILAALLQTTVLTLLSASIPLTMTLTSALIAMNSSGSSRNIIRNPTLQESQSADSVHVLAFTSHGHLLVAESEGSFTLEDWDEVYQIGKALCCGGVETSDDYAMQADGLGETGYMRFIRSTLDEKVSNDLYWKD